MEAGKFFTDEITALLKQVDNAISSAGASPEALAATGKTTRTRLKQAVAQELGVKVTAVRFDSAYDAFKSTTEDDENCSTLVVVLGAGIRAIVHPGECAVGSAMSRLHREDLEHRAKAKRLCAERCRIADLGDTKHVKAFKARLRAVYGKLPEDHATLRSAFTEWMRYHAPHACPA